MNDTQARLIYTLVVLHLFLLHFACAQKLTSNIPYVESGHERQILDIYQPENMPPVPGPVMFWIHGGGWQAGDKSSVGLKPKILTNMGFVFVSTNYRLLPDVEMEELTRDIARSISWVYKNISKYGGDPKRIIIGGHSAGAQLAALICTDSTYLEEEKVPFEVLKGCIPVDGDTYDIPKIIMTAELTQLIYQEPLPTSGHRQKFGNDPKKHINFSAITHVAKDRGIPPFLILYFTGNPNTTAQARIFSKSLQEAGVPVKILGASNSNHTQLNNDLGKEGDPATREFLAFLSGLL